MRRALAAMVCAAAIVAGAGEARAAFHLMKITEVFGGAPSAPQAQYVVLQMWTGGQNFVGGHSIIVYGATDVELARFTFPGTVASGTSQARILIATTQAAALFGVTADLTMTASLPAAGGKVCFDAIDCVAWGNYTGSATGVGPPFSPVLGLQPGRAARRRLEIFGSPTLLEDADDTGSSANDFRFGAPAPINNAGAAGTAPPSVCGNGAVTGLESCDDGNTASGDGCSAACLDEACGDTVVNDAGETCDDGNTVNGDGCDNNCRTTACGNGVVTAGEQCDDGNVTSGDGCDANCRPTGCGNTIITAGEICDDGNMTSGDGCDANCTPTGCGNGIVTAGEDCEPPGVGSCDASCQLPCVTNADCADSDPCTTNERCVPAGCLVDLPITDDGEPCTVDACGPGGVTHTPLPDGMTCTLAPMPGTPAVCVAGVCRAEGCGDGFTDPGATPPEACDDGNDSDLDACTTACEVARCGDGFVHAGQEGCDDGNLVEEDTCTTACLPARCGDGFAQPGETCDDGNTTAGDGCNATCQAERCGDGVEQLGETCDDGNTTNGDGCSAVCLVETDVPEDDGGGCCGTGGGRGAPGAMLLALAVFAGVSRRRRAR